MKIIIILAVAAMLAGCSTLDGLLVNRAACTLGGEQRELLVTSFWGRWGLTSKIHPDDARAACAQVQPVILQITPQKGV
jgi:hypothetical protein